MSAGVDGTVREGITDLFEYSGGSTTGACRDINEDCFEILEPELALLVVDGCGTPSSGEGVGQRVVEAFASVLRGSVNTSTGPVGADLLADAVVHANQEIFREAQENPDRRGLGAALCAVRIVRGWLVVAHVGDCRVGRFRA